MALDVSQLLRMSQAELDDLFRNSPPGDMPTGEGEGPVILAPGTELSELAAKFLRFFAWQGKVFNPAKGDFVA